MGAAYIERRGARHPQRHAWFHGGTYSLSNFVSEFVDLGGGDIDEWPDDKLMPLVEYIYSLRAPANLEPPPAVDAAQGALLFHQMGCVSCHDGPRGGGKQIYDYAQMGTDPQLKKWADPELTGDACCGLRFQEGEQITHGVKSPRLAGAWAFERFLHNGSVDSLEDLFCLEHARPSIDGVGYSDSGHNQTCDGLSNTEKRALMAYLRSR